MIHVVFQHADVTTLKNTMEIDGSLAGEIHEIKDDFAVGPLEELDTAAGWQKRMDWWKDILSDSPFDMSQFASFDDRHTVDRLKACLSQNEQEAVWIWMGQNQHDVCGYYWLISQLKEFVGRVYVLFMNNLPFINEKGQIFYPTTLHEILPKEFLKAKKLNRKVTLSEFELDPEEFRRLSGENAIVRILEGGKKIVGKGADFYDSDIIAGLNPTWMKGNKAMSTILGKMKLKTGDLFLFWRMKVLAGEDKIELSGDASKGWKEFEVRLKTNTPEPISTSIEPIN